MSKSAVSEEGEKAEVGMEKSEGVGRSVLDDMSAFQAEIDALRAQQQGVGKGGEGL